ncbi:MAG: matrixin family metalloprotease, partial [Pseudohongiellaceae bacterium]
SCDDETKERIRFAANEASSYSLQIVHTGTFNKYEQDNRNTIGCALDSPFVASLMPPSADGLVYEDQHLIKMIEEQLFILGKTRTWHYPSTGEIVEFDIWLNELWTLVDRVAWQTISHEWGHALGLPHSQYGESLMAPSDGWHSEGTT